MLYHLDLDGEASTALEPVPFSSLADLEKVEKDLERILAENLFGVLFDDARLLPIHQERAYQAEADIYAVNETGDLFVFELKRGSSGRDAVVQLLEYGEKAGQWGYDRLDQMYRDYTDQVDSEEESLQDAHQSAYQLDQPLQSIEFNRDQHFRVVGHAADEDLVDAVDYWKSTGLRIDFVPYRVYEVGEELLFEFFSLPYDRHRNPADRKGVLFDTNASYSEESVWEMMEKGRVAAYGGARRFADHVQPDDLVFFYHKGEGIIAAGEVTGDLRKIEKEDHHEWYREVEFLTSTPDRADGIERAMSPSEIRETLDQSFFWARTIKVPYLDWDEAQELLQELQAVLQPEDGNDV